MKYLNLNLKFSLDFFLLSVWTLTCPGSKVPSHHDDHRKHSFLSQPEARAAGSILSSTVVVAFYLSSIQNILGPNTVPFPPVVPAVTEATWSISGACSQTWLCLHYLSSEGGFPARCASLSNLQDAWQIPSHGLAASCRWMGLLINKKTLDWEAPFLEVPRKLPHSLPKSLQCWALL